MVAAVIDCGTNTFHLLVAEYDKLGNYKILKRELKNVKLGQHTILNKRISDEAFERGVKSFSELAKSAQSFNPEKIVAYATSAVRSSVNGEDFVEEVFRQTGVKINVIEGDREALLIYKGAKLALGNIDDTILIMDIGGGSTEFILAKNSNIIYKHSFDLGVARMLQKFNPSDPISPDNIADISSFFASELVPLQKAIENNPPAMLIGCSGSFESIHSIVSHNIYSIQPDENITVTEIKSNDFHHVLEILIKSSEADRYNIKGLATMRIDTIVLAVIFIDFVMNNFSIPKMFFSNYALKEGALAELIKK